MIDASVIREATGLPVTEPVQSDALGFVSDRSGKRILTFMDDMRYWDALVANPAVVGAFVPAALADALRGEGRTPVVCDDPRFHFYSVMNHLARRGYTTRPSVIHETARIHPRAHVAEHNVTIGPDCVIEPNATILPDVILGRGCVIRAGAVLGSEGFEHKRTSRGILPVFHDGTVRLGDRVEIGANSCLDKGFSWRHTTLDDDTKIDNLVHIAHAAQLGKRCLVAASAMVAGSATLGDDVWVGPNANISSGVAVGNGAYVTLGAVVTRAVGDGEKVTGNFAIPHDRFMRHLKSIVSG